MCSPSVCLFRSDIIVIFSKPVNRLTVKYDKRLPAAGVAMDCSQIKKAFKLEWRCHQLLSGFLVKGYLLRVSRQSCLSASDKGDNEMIPGDCAQISWNLS